jgi:hypothetical protein
MRPGTFAVPTTQWVQLLAYAAATIRLGMCAVQIISSQFQPETEAVGAAARSVTQRWSSGQKMVMTTPGVQQFTVGAD